MIIRCVLYYTISCLLVATSCTSNSTLDKPFHVLKVTKKKSTARTGFGALMLQNTTNERISVTGVVSSCDCILPDFSDSTIVEANDTLLLSFTYNLNNEKDTCRIETFTLRTSLKNLLFYHIKVKVCK
jgi:hypothetical protein